eukprot:CAMPEP_0196133050 /NCGR_PEP_ID=MMETSP0910-20130528/2432_1 /TAXON_ID=49265 /ORGANISM="Thalassiosira rotula, Strain GSO102" /LENGTH=699 /DNA_ID=CAMNT_0041392731 /DNA_START=86 /DNA_END=2182 /DNA_ORIENTATION=+
MSMICQSPTNHPLPPSYFADAAIECAQLRLASAEKWVAASMQLLTNARYQLSSSQHELNDARECLTRLLEDAASMQYLPMEEQQQEEEQRAVMLDKDDIGDIGDIVVTLSKEANANATVNATVEKEEEETLMMMAGDTDNETHSESCNTGNSKNREKMESMTELKPFESNLKPFHDIDNHAIGGIEDDDDDNNNISRQLSDKSNDEMRSPTSNNESPTHFTGRRSNNSNDDSNATKRTRSNSKGSAGSKSTVSGKSRLGSSPESSIRESISAARQAIIQIGKTGSYTNISSVGSRGSTTGSMGSNASSKKVSVTWESTTAIAAAAATTGGEDGTLLASSDTPQITTSPRGTALVKKSKSERDMVREAMQRSFFSKSKSSRSVILRPSRKAATEEAEAVRKADGGGDAQLSTTMTVDARDGDNGREAMETLGEAKQSRATAVGTSDNAKGDGSSTPRESIAQIGERRSFASPESTASPSGQDEVVKEAQSTTTTTTTTEARKETKEAQHHGTSTIASDALRTFRNSILSKMETPRERPSPLPSSPPPPSRTDDSNDDEDVDRRDPGAAIDVVQCGIPEINGRYHRFEIIDGVPSYSKIQSYEGKEAIFTIGRWNSDSNDDDNGNNDNDDDNNNGDDNNNNGNGGTTSSKKWHVTATIPHREKELAFYVAYAPSSARHPPSKNWMVVEGNEDFLEEGRYEG